MPTTPVLGMHKYQLDTPCLLLDIELLLQNLNTMQQHANIAGINLRPHSKTHKCSTLAKLQLKYGAIGISVAKLSEAEVLVHQGISSILITSPIVTPYKIKKLMELLNLAPELMIVVDNKFNCDTLNMAASQQQQKIKVLVDVNSGIGRTGVQIEHALELAQYVHNTPWLELVGIQCYAGNLQHIQTYKVRKAQSTEIMEKASQLLETCKNKGLPVTILTGGGTGTYDIDSLVSGVTEIQPGSYTVMDVEYTTLGSKENQTAFTAFQPSMTLLTSVISANQSTHVTVDAGTKGIYIDTVHQPRIINQPELSYDWGGFGDEHGKITATSGATLPVLGDVLELVVPHCDPTINLYDRFYITQHGHVIDVWEIDMRGKSQ